MTPGQQAEPLRIILDASAIVGAGYGRATAFRRLLRDAADKRLELLVPELAISETLAVLRRKLENMKIASREAARILAAGGVAMPEVDDMVRACEEYIRTSLAESSVVPLPSRADHDELVRRILVRRKPTKPAARNTKGDELDDQPEDYRDQLMWAMVRDAAGAGPLIFVSDNTKDFADEAAIDRPNGTAGLHADLVADLDEDRDAGRGTGTVEMYLSIRRVADELLSRPDDEDARAEVQRGLTAGADASLAVELRAAVHQGTPSVTAYVPSIPLTSEIEDAYVVDIGRTVDAQVVDAFQEAGETEPRRYAVSLDVQADAEVAWHASALSSYDLDALSSLVESADAGGLIQDVDSGETLHLRVGAIFVPSEVAWYDVEIEEAEQPEHVRRERLARIPDPWADLLSNGPAEAS